MALASCQKPETEKVQPQEYEYTFLIGNADTKATVGETCVEWEDGDQMGVYAKTSGAEISYNAKGFITPGEPATMQVYSFEPLAVGDMIYTYYPYAESNSTVPTDVALSIPVEQDGKDDMPMVSIPLSVTSSIEAYTNTQVDVGAIKLVNLGSVIEFNVYTETDAYAAEVVKSVTFEADKAIAGAFTFDLTKVDYSDESTLSIAGLTETTVVANASDLAVGTKDAPSVVKMVVAPGTYSGSIVVTTDAATYTYTISAAKEFNRSAVKPLGLNLESENATRVENVPEAWVLTSFADLKEGDQVVIVGTKSLDQYAMSNDKGTGAAPSPISVTTSGNKLASDPATNVVWYVGKDGNNRIFYATSAKDKWLYCTSTNNGVRVGDNTNKTFTWSDNYLKHVGTSRYLGIYNTHDWRCYTSINSNITGQTFQFYVKTGGSNEGTEEPTPELTVTPEIIEVPADGGTAELGYTVTNPVEGVNVSAVTEVTWLSDFVYTATNTVKFTVAKNTSTEARETVITLSYEGAESKTVTVKQAGAGATEPEEPTASITILKTIADIAKANGWSNSSKYGTINLDGVITATATGGANTGKYYTNGENWRIYQGENPTLKISASDGYTIKSVKITYSVENSGVLTCNSSNVTSGDVVSVNATSISFGVGNTGAAQNGQVRVTAIEVVYFAN